MSVHGIFAALGIKHQLAVCLALQLHHARLGHPCSRQLLLATRSFGPPLLLLVQGLELSLRRPPLHHATAAVKFVLQRGGLMRVLRGEAVWVLRVDVLQRRDGARVIDERVAGSVVTLERAPLLMHHCTCACTHTFLVRERETLAQTG